MNLSSLLGTPKVNASVNVKKNGINATENNPTPPITYPIEEPDTTAENPTPLTGGARKTKSRKNRSHNIRNRKTRNRNTRNRKTKDRRHH